MNVEATTADSGGRGLSSIAVIAAVAVVGAFASTFVNLARLWSTDTNYSHGWLIPLFAIVPAYLHLKKTGVPERGNTVLGLLYMLVGGMLHLVAQLLAMPPADFFALFCSLRGMAIAIGGREWAGGFNFAFAFLMFMFPIPHSWTAYSSLWLQEIVSRVSATVIDPFVPVFRRGNSLNLAGVSTPLVVAEECSGLRQIIAFVACGAYIAYFGRGRMWKKIALVLSAVPVAIAANVLRISLMAFGGLWFGTNWMSGTLHDTPALFSIPAGLLIYFAIAWLLGLTSREPEKGGAS